MPVVRRLSHLRQLLVRDGNTDGTIAQALTFHRTNPRLLTTSRGWQDYHQLRNGAKPSRLPARTGVADHG